MAPPSQELLRILEKETGISGKKKRFSGNVVRQNLKKEWGKDQDEVNCYAVTLDALLRETPKNQYVKKFRPSLFQLMVEELPVTVFEYTPELLKDAINKFEGPYGHVAMIDKVGRAQTDRSSYPFSLSRRQPLPHHRLGQIRQGRVRRPRDGQGAAQVPVRRPSACDRQSYIHCHRGASASRGGRYVLERVPAGACPHTRAESGPPCVGRMVVP